MPSDNIFTSAVIKSVVLPTSITELPESMFAECKTLTNVYFSEAQFYDTREEILNLIPNELSNNVPEGEVHIYSGENLFKIGAAAFKGTDSITDLHIYDNITTTTGKICENWNGSQTIHIHNENKNFTKNWHQDTFTYLDPNSIIYDATYYTITLDAGEGTVDPTEKDVKFKKEVGELPVPVLPYHVFDGWYDKDGNLYTAETVYTVESDIKLTAHYTEYTYNVQYKPNRPNLASSPVVGKMDPSNHVYSVESALTTNAYSIAGWHFTGWTTAEDGSGESFTDGQTVSKLNEENSGTTTLYAQWEQNEYFVEYDKNLPSAVTGTYRVEGTMENSHHTYDVYSQLRQNAYTLMGWEFKGWNTESDGTGNSFTDGKDVGTLCAENGGTAILYAQWQIVEYAINYIDPENGYNPNADIKTYTIETPTIVFKDPEIDGYDGKWTPASIPQYSTGNIDVRASYNELIHNITFVLNGGTNHPNNDNYYKETVHYELKTPTKLGYRFVGWLCNGNYITNLDGFKEELRIEAIWEKIVQLLVTDTEVLLTDTNSVIVLPEAQFSTSCKLMVNSGVQVLTITSSTDILYSLNIEVLSRSLDLNITLNNVKMHAPNDCAAISMSSNYTLNLYTTGTCEIHGGNGSMGNRNSFQELTAEPRAASFGGMGGFGKSAIVCYKLVIHTSNVKLYGGNGGRGADGENVYGTTGGNGFSGGKGGNGINVTDSVTFFGSNIKVIGGNGGNGGNGGTRYTNSPSSSHSNGGAGGKGAPAVLGNIIGSANLVQGKNGNDGLPGYTIVKT